MTDKEYDEYGQELDEDGETIEDGDYAERDENGLLLDSRLLSDYIAYGNSTFADIAALEIGVPKATYLLYVLNTALVKAKNEPLPTKEDILIAYRSGESNNQIDSE